MDITRRSHDFSGLGINVMTDLSSRDLTERETETTSTWILLQIADSGKSIFKYVYKKTPATLSSIVLLYIIHDKDPVRVLCNKIKCTQQQ